MPYQQRDALLNIFNRRKMKAADFIRIGRGYYLRHSPEHEIPIIADSEDKHNITILFGYETALHMASRDGSSEPVAQFKADLTHRLITTDSVHEIIEKARARHRNEDDFRKEVEMKLLGIYFFCFFCFFWFFCFDFKNTKTHVITTKTQKKISFWIIQNDRLQLKK